MKAKKTTKATKAKSLRGHARVLDSQRLYLGHVFELRRDSVVEPGGVHATRDVVVHPGSVVVMPVLQDGRILLIRQYRHSVGDFLWEIVAGRKEPGETPEKGAARELLEETGYTAKKFRKMLDVFPAPGFVTERMWIFAAEGLTKGEAQPEEDERIEPRAFTVKQIDVMIRDGKLRDAKSVCGLLYYMRYIAHVR